MNTMKKMMLLSVGVSLLTMPALVHANEHKEHHRMSIEEMDKNADKKVSLDEFTQVKMDWIKKKFSKLDTNKDGFITQKEMDQKREQYREKRNEFKTSRFEKLDTNKDGQISKNEFMAAKRDMNHKKES